MAGNIDTATLATATLANYSKTMIDNAIRQIAALAYMRSKKNRKVDGGEPIKYPIIYGENSTIQSINKRSKLATDEQEILTDSKYNWGIVGGTVTLPEFDVDILNAGSGRLLDIVKPQFTVAEKTLATVIDGMLHTPRATAEAIWSFDDMISDADPASYTTETFGQIDRDTYTWWKSTVLDKTANPNMQISYINELYVKLTNGSDHPNLGLCGEYQYLAIEELLGNKVQLDESMAALGFETIKHKQMTIMLDKGFTAARSNDDEFLALNTDYIDFIESEKWGPKVGKFESPVDQFILIAKIAWAGQLACSNCSRQGKITNLATS